MQYFDINEARKKLKIHKVKEIRRPKQMNTTLDLNLTMQKKFSDCSNLFIDSPFIKPEKQKLHSTKVRLESITFRKMDC